MTAVALSIATGANDRQVARWAGHQSVAFTKDRYGHLFAAHGEAVVARLDALIAEATPSATAVGMKPDLVCQTCVTFRRPTTRFEAHNPCDLHLFVGDEGFDPPTSAV